VPGSYPAVCPLLAPSANHRIGPITHIVDTGRNTTDQRPPRDAAAPGSNRGEQPNREIAEQQEQHSTLGAWAATYGEAHYDILPLRAKVPLTPHGVLDATSHPDIIAQWWDRWPDANIGCRVPEGILVLDVDPRNGGAKRLAELEREHGDLPPTRTTISGRGDGGQHLWFLHPGGRVSGSRLGSGLDIKTSTGYVVLPPSIHPKTGQPYRWQEPVAIVAWPPTWLQRLLLPPRPYLMPVRANGASDSDALVRFVRVQPEGNRNAGLFWAACRAVELDATAATFERLVCAAMAAGLSSTEAWRTVRSAMRRAS
jgi:Bifunctional DNA primase/polymerase, N-terminal